MDMGRQETLSHGLADMPDGNPVTIATARGLVDGDAAARDGESESSGDSYRDAESFSSSGESTLNEYGQEGDEDESLSSHAGDDEGDEIAEAYNGAKKRTWPLVVSMRELWWWQQVVLVLLVAVGLTGVAAAMAATAKVGDLLFLPAPVWPPTGLALFAVLALGYRIWPALFLSGTALSLTYGALHVTLPRLQLILYSLVIATDRTLFVLLLAFFLMRFLRPQPTDLTPLDRDLKKSKEELEEAGRAKTEFLANMSHEIRTPIHGIIGMTALAMDTLESLRAIPLPPIPPPHSSSHSASAAAAAAVAALAERSDLTVEVHEHLTVVAQSADCLLNIANTVLDLARIEAGQLALDKVPFRLRDVVGSTMRMLQVRAEQKQLGFSWHVAEKVPLELMGDPGRLQQCLINLVHNSSFF
ncbi:unnamed protein product [Closterium sp. Yama58-4]|nr:unnamed protein product [Closterium sp. Yama58-4]